MMLDWLKLSKESDVWPQRDVIKYIRCSVVMDGKAVNTCMVLAVEAEGTEIETIEGLAPGDGLDPLRARRRDDGQRREEDRQGDAEAHVSSSAAPVDTAG